MSFEAMTWALEQPVGGNDKLVLLLIANRIHKDQGFCWPKIRTIAEEAGISYSTVQRCINSLIERGFMTVQRTHAQDGSLGAYRFYMANDKISPDWEKFRREDRPTGQNDQSSPTGQNDRTHRSNCYLGTGQNDRTKPIRLTSKRTSKSTPLISPALSRVEEPTNRKGSRLPLDWQPTQDLIAFAGDLGLDGRTIADSFRDYWVAVPGAKGSKLDWAATWRNWCRNEVKRFKGKTAPGKPQSPLSQQFERMKRQYGGRTEA